MDSDEATGRRSSGDERDVRAGRELDRLLAFSDGVIAIAITLLVLKIEIPDLPETPSQAELVDTVEDLIPNIVTFIWSFLVLSRFWVVHRRLFSGLDRSDSRLTGLNILFLLLIALLPFPSDLLGRFGPSTLSIALYAGLIAMTGFVSAAMGQYVDRHPELVTSGVSLKEEHQDAFNAYITPVVFLLSIGIAFINADLAAFTWILLAFRPLRRRRHRSRRTGVTPSGR